MTYTEDDRYTDSNQQHWMWSQTFWEQTNLLLPVTEWWTDGHSDAWRQVKRRNDSMIAGRGGWKPERPNGGVHDEPTKQRKRGRRKWCLLEVRQEHFPLWVASIWSIGFYTHPHTHFVPQHGYWDWIIDRIGTDRSQRTAEVSLICPVIVYSKRKTIGILISSTIVSTVTWVTLKITFSEVRTSGTAT